MKIATQLCVAIRKTQGRTPLKPIDIPVVAAETFGTLAERPATRRSLRRKALIVFAALTLYEFVVWCIDGWTGHTLNSALRWLHPVTGGLIWPVVFGVLSRTHRPR